MSRLGKIPIQIPSGVDVKLADGSVRVKGPKGELDCRVVDGVEITIDDGKVTVTRKGDSRAERSAHGLMRRLVANMVEGTSDGFSRSLEIQGVGYRADAKGSIIDSNAHGLGWAAFSQRSGSLDALLPVQVPPSKILQSAAPVLAFEKFVHLFALYLHSPIIGGISAPRSGVG